MGKLVNNEQEKQGKLDIEKKKQLLDQARKIIVKTDYASAAFLGKELRIPFEHAVEIFDLMKEENVIDEKTWNTGKKIDKVLETAIEKTRDTRKNVITVRVSDKTLNILDELITFSISQSRSEAAYMLIVEGIKAQKDFLDKLSEKNEKLELLRKSVLSETNRISDFGRE